MSFGGDFEGQPQRVKDQAINLLVDGAIGQGAHRIVYGLKHSPNLVMKVEKDACFANIKEWMVWDELRWDARCAEWLVPCVDIDFRGGVLLQMRARDLSDAEWEALGDVPAWLSDTKRSNWGWHDGRPKMRDYGMVGKMLSMATRTRRTVPKIGD